MGGMMSGGMMGGGFGSGLGSFGLVGSLIGLLPSLVVIVGIVVLVIWAVRRFSSNRQSSDPYGQTPREIAAERYAYGEITLEQYQELLSVLG